MSIPLTISRIAEAANLKDSGQFADFCMEQLDQAKAVIHRDKSSIPLDSVLFHVYMVLDFRQERMEVALSDRLVEALFQFLGDCIPLYADVFAANGNDCLFRCLHAFVFVSRI